MPPRPVIAARLLVCSRLCPTDELRKLTAPRRVADLNGGGTSHTPGRSATDKFPDALASPPKKFALFPASGN